MNIKIKGKSNNIAVIRDDSIIISDVQSALDVAMEIKYGKNISNFIIPKECIIEDFFILSTRLAGEILQKYMNYGIRLAIIGDFSRYTSKPLHDFIYESNNGQNFYFVSTEEEAVKKLEVYTESNVKNS